MLQKVTGKSEPICHQPALLHDCVSDTAALIHYFLGGCQTQANVFEHIIYGKQFSAKNSSNQPQTARQTQKKKTE